MIAVLHHEHDSEPNKGSRLPLALGIAVCMSLALTVVSVVVYYTAGFYKFDLSRPGFESVRKDVVNTDTPKSYDTTTPVNSAALDGFLGEYDANVNSMRAYGDFQDSTALSDKALLLAPGDTNN